MSIEKREEVAVSLFEFQMYEEALAIYSSLYEEGYDTYSLGFFSKFKNILIKVFRFFRKNQNDTDSNNISRSQSEPATV